MTFRNVLKRKANIFFASMAAFYALAIAAVFSVANVPTQIYALSFFALIFAPLVILRWYFRCPRCGGSMGALVANFGPLRFLAKPVNFCPSCGVALDEQVAA